jgi:hypothetical protein
MLKQNAATSADNPTNAHPVRRPSRLTSSSVTFATVVSLARSTSAMLVANHRNVGPASEKD